MGLKRIRLELARNPGFPEGSARHGYELVAPLTDSGHLDTEAWRSPELRRRCMVRRFWGGEEDQHGSLRFTRHRAWAFSYAPGEEDDEPLHHLESHAIREGEYVTVREADGRTLTFRIVSVDG